MIVLRAIVLASRQEGLKPGEMLMGQDGADQEPQFDERPAALMANELRFSFLKSMMTSAITLVGGGVALKVALVPAEPIDVGFLAGLGLCAMAGINAFDGQMRVVKRLEQRRAKPSLWERGVNVLTPYMLVLGAILILDYFFRAVDHTIQ